MNQPHVYPGTHELAEAVVEESLEILRQSIDAHDVAVWVLAGGTAPMEAYRLIAKQHLDALDWSKVTFLIGDERIGPLDGPDNNWHAIEQEFLRHIPQATFIRPPSDQGTKAAAQAYEKLLAVLPEAWPGAPRLDLVWLGMGEDGHTLSLFPDQLDAALDSRLVIPVYDSPKPPAERISFTLRALEGAENTMILASGSNKADTLEKALHLKSHLPIALAAKTTKAQWYVDKAATTTLSKKPQKA